MNIGVIEGETLPKVEPFGERFHNDFCIFFNLEIFDWTETGHFTHLDRIPLNDIFTPNLVGLAKSKQKYFRNCYHDFFGR